jgi:glycine cleavage system transcriptional repressor
MQEKDHLILTAIGPDQVGLVAKISEFISRHGCNIEDSKMAVFYGEFAVIVLISGERARLAEVGRHCHDIEKETGLSVAVKTPTARKPAESFLPYKLTASCMDHPGVVYHISDILSSLGVNIDSMETKTYSAPVSGTPLFQLEAKLSIPARVNINRVRDRFTEFQAEENIDIDIAAIKVVH